MCREDLAKCVHLDWKADLNGFIRRVSLQIRQLNRNVAWIGTSHFALGIFEDWIFRMVIVEGRD